MKIHFALALPQQCFRQGWQDFTLRAPAFTLATSAKMSMRSELVKLLPLLHISPKMRSIMCTILFKLLKDHQYAFKVRCHPLFVAACIIIIAILFTYMTSNRFTFKAHCYQFGRKQGCVSSSSKVASIQFIKEVLCRLNCFVEV